MRRLSRTLFRELCTSALLGSVLFTFVLFLERARRLFEFLVSDSGSTRTVVKLFALVLPEALPFAIPLGVLVGTLITLSRMSSDGEITAMRACGVSGRRVAPPILAFGFLGMCVAAAASLWLTPWSIRERFRIQNQLTAGQLTANIQPRHFIEEQFPNLIVYVSDVAPGSTLLKRLFLADISPSSDRGDNPLVTLATEAIALPDSRRNLLQLNLRNPNNYSAPKDLTDGKYKIFSQRESVQALQARPPNEATPFHPETELDTGPLYRRAYGGDEPDPVHVLQARIELHQRLAFPFACVLLGLTGIPLGIGTRRSGSSSAYVLTVALAFAYDLGMISLVKLAAQRTLPVGPALWLPNMIFAVFGITMLMRLESPGDRDYIGRITGFLRNLVRAPRQQVPRILDRVQGRMWTPRFPLLPQVVDTYVVGSFLFYFVLSLATFVMMTHVFTFFELLSDIIKNRIGMAVVLQYHFYLSARLIYDFTPVSVLTSVLVVLGVLGKNNEITAFKACGVSVYRLSVPIFAASLLISGSLFAFDHYWVPEADRRQDAIYNEIKGRPAQTFLDPGHKWTYGLHDRIYYFKYFDQPTHVMSGVSVYEIDPGSFHLKSHIVAASARWEPGLKAWVFQNGRRLDINGDGTYAVDDFSGDTRTFSELEETPDYFFKEDIQARKMNFQELNTYIHDLQQSGFDTVKLRVQFYKKFSVPLFALILAMVSVPFGLQAGNRGRMAGVGISIAIFILYWSVGQFFEQVGNLNQLTPLWLAAWSPDAVFALAGLYFLARMRT